MAVSASTRAEEEERGVSRDVEDEDVSRDTEGAGEEDACFRFCFRAEISESVGWSTSASIAEDRGGAGIATGHFTS